RAPAAGQRGGEIQSTAHGASGADGRLRGDRAAGDAPVAEGPVRIEPRAGAASLEVRALARPGAMEDVLLPPAGGGSTGEGGVERTRTAARAGAGEARSGTDGRRAGAGACARASEGDQTAARGFDGVARTRFGACEDRTAAP